MRQKSLWSLGLRHFGEQTEESYQHREMEPNFRSASIERTRHTSEGWKRGGSGSQEDF